MKTKLQKQEEAAIRQAEYTALSSEEKLARANARGGSTRELLRLAKRINKEESGQAK